MTVACVLDGAAVLCRQLAIYSMPFRWHQMTILKLIMAVLRCRTGVVLACVLSSDIIPVIIIMMRPFL